MRHRVASLALVASTLLAGCQIGFGEGENAVPAVWDLRTSHRIDDVNWPEGIDSDSDSLATRNVWTSEVG